MLPIKGLTRQFNFCDIISLQPFNSKTTQISVVTRIGSSGT